MCAYLSNDYYAPAFGDFSIKTVINPLSKKYAQRAFLFSSLLEKGFPYKKGEYCAFKQRKPIL